MTAKNEAIELLESARDRINPGRYIHTTREITAFNEIDQALAKLKEQPPASEFTEHIREQVRYICEMMQGKHSEEDVDWEALLTQVLALCGSLDASEASRKESLKALEMCERARACGQIEKIDKIILQAAIEKETNIQTKEK